VKIADATDPRQLARPHIRVVCIDDHELLRDGIALILASHRDMELVGSAGTVAEAVRLFEMERPDVILMDVWLGTVRSVETIRTICHRDPRARIIALGVSHSVEDVQETIGAGAVTYLFKDVSSRDLVHTIREVAAGRRPLQPEVDTLLHRRHSHQQLTCRESEVMQLMAQGMRNHEIAEALGISELTVQVHVKNIFTKLNVSDRTAAVYAALRRGLVRIPQ
jgi:DNA-binding NarL/FixJ family response regulator